MPELIALIESMNLPDPHREALEAMSGVIAVTMHRLGCDLKDEILALGLLIEVIAEARAR